MPAVQLAIVQLTDESDDEADVALLAALECAVPAMTPAQLALNKPSYELEI